ncbi:hypothetical protein [Anaeromyxobacter oryzae]|uniref:Uncharacterized protein n=1 Tax=Anaeromyxobacter oryzae TaxID=2918170 RepID=A0ABN6MNS8_9BACT|nr:hypothetical protein [Anaeromyxobacter oryzae]BDG01960.1 hypothetical protein AMOR_09560 [Anaeromyxobacter oryzae]
MRAWGWVLASGFAAALAAAACGGGHGAPKGSGGGGGGTDGGGSTGGGSGGGTGGGGDTGGGGTGGGTGGGGATGGGGTGGGTGGPTVKAPVQMGDFLFYSTDQGLTPEISDVSADEGGNVYVAGGSAVFAKRHDDQDFKKFDLATAGVTANCWDPKEIDNPTPAGPPQPCPVISVAGAAPGKAVLGLKGVGIDYDYDAPWALDSGGADLVSFDGTTLTKDRHVFIASPPGVICEHWANPPDNTICNETWVDSTWMSGRKKDRQVRRIVVNHDKRRPLSYGDVFFGSTHGSISILVAHPDQRGWIDYTRGDPKWAETKGIWEHEHPAISAPDGRFLTGESMALALDPTTNVPWFANEVRTASLPDYATTSHPSWNGWWGAMSPPSPFLALWGDAADATHWDVVTGISFCDDGTMWVGSVTYGLKRRDPSGNWSQVPLPASTDQRVSTVACDPSDGSIWVGFDYGGFGRLKDGTWQGVPQGAPAFASNRVTSIQFDRWSSPRLVYLAHGPSAKLGAGGVTVYAGP